MWLILIITLLSVWFLWAKWRLSYWKRQGVPGPEPNLVVGNIGPTMNWTEHYGSLTHKWYSEFKNVPYIGYYKLLVPAVVLRDAELIKNVLIRDIQYFAENDFQILEKHDPIFHHNPFLLKAENWKRARNVMVPSMTAGKIKSIFPMMEGPCEKLVKYLKSQPIGKDFEAKALSARFNTELVVKCVFSLDGGCFEPGKNEFRDISKKIFEPSFEVSFKFLIMPALPRWFTAMLPLSILSSEVNNWFLNIIKENKISREKAQPDDLLQSLFNAGDKYDASEAELAGFAFTLFHEGFETTSTVLSFALHEIARHPEVQERIYKEIIQVSASYNDKFSYEALQEMIYLDCVIKESQRMYPVILHMTKLCTAEYTLPPVGDQKDGVKIAPGTTVIIPMRAIHMDPEIYPNPETFDPDRFSEEQNYSRHSAHYLAFGTGPRMCVGMRFGHAQVKVGIMTLVRNFKITLSPKQKPIVPDPKSFFFAAKDGIYLNFVPRE